jgi:hypothetical protein
VKLVLEAELGDHCEGLMSTRQDPAALPCTCHVRGKCSWCLVERTGPVDRKFNRVVEPIDRCSELVET